MTACVCVQDGVCTEPCMWGDRRVHARADKRVHCVGGDMAWFRTIIVCRSIEQSRCGGRRKLCRTVLVSARGRLIPQNVEALDIYYGVVMKTP